jgi:predicted DNA binding CopG/RHH family protein
MNTDKSSRGMKETQPCVAEYHPKSSTIRIRISTTEIRKVTEKNSGGMINR